MQRRVIELSGGEMVRDERGGGYGDTASIPRLTPEVEKGAAAVAALSAVLEVQREVTGRTGPLQPLPTTDAAPAPRAEAADAAPEAAAAPASDAPADEPTRQPREPGTNTGFIPVTTPQVDELGLADRLGLGKKTDRSDEVGPTS
jgi:cell division transport system ATP-binding protein